MCYPVDCPCVPSFCQAAYDKVRKARKQAAERTQKLDERRKKVKLGRWHRGAGALRFTWVVFMQLLCTFASVPATQSFGPQSWAQPGSQGWLLKDSLRNNNND